MGVLATSLHPVPARGTVDASSPGTQAHAARICAHTGETCKSRGFGFVIFEDEAALARVLASRMHMIDDTQVRGGGGGGEE